MDIDEEVDSVHATPVTNNAPSSPYCPSEHQSPVPTPTTSSTSGGFSGPHATTPPNSSKAGGRRRRTPNTDEGRQKRGGPGFLCVACDISKPIRPTVSCRTCCKLYHPVCAGYDPPVRRYPPVEWICPLCPGGERGSRDDTVHSSMKGQGTCSSGTQPWCPICFRDNRLVGGGKKTTDKTGEKCRGCGLKAHGKCVRLARRLIGDDGDCVYNTGVGGGGTDGKDKSKPWPCRECERRRDGDAARDACFGARLEAAAVVDGVEDVSSCLASPESDSWSASSPTPDRDHRKRISRTPSTSPSLGGRNEQQQTPQAGAAEQAGGSEGTSAPLRCDRLPAREAVATSPQQSPTSSSRMGGSVATCGSLSPKLSKFFTAEGKVRHRKGAAAAAARLTAAVTDPSCAAERPPPSAKPKGSGAKPRNNGKPLAARFPSLGKGGGPAPTADGGTGSAAASKSRQGTGSASIKRPRKEGGSSRGAGGPPAAAVKSPFRRVRRPTTTAGGAAARAGGGAGPPAAAGAVICVTCKYPGKSRGGKTCGSCQRWWHGTAACSAVHESPGAGKWVGGWRCRDCLTKWQDSLRDRTAVVAEAWEAHEARRRRNADVYRVAQEIAAKESEEERRYGFRVGNVHVVSPSPSPPPPLHFFGDSCSGQNHVLGVC